MKVRRTAGALGLGLALAVAAAAPAPAAIVLKLDGIPGEAQSAQYAGQIELESAQFGAGRVVAKDAKIGTTSFSELTVSKLLDRSSPALFQRVATGQTIPAGKLTWYSSGPDGPVEYQRICLTGLTISGYSQSSGGDRPSESISIAYQTLRQTYVQQDEGGGSQPFSFGWDVVKNALLGQQACA